MLSLTGDKPTPVDSGAQNHVDRGVLLEIATSPARLLNLAVHSTTVIRSIQSGVSVGFD